MASTPPSRDAVQSARVTPPVRKAPTKPVFDPTKAVMKQSLDRSSSTDLFGEIMREATDGDSTEAETRAALGLSQADRAGDDQVLERARKNSVSAAPDPTQVSAEQGQDQPPAQDTEAVNVTVIGKTQNAQAVEKATAQPAASIGMSRHELLMRLSTTMGREQTSTYGSEEAAEKARNRMSSRMWQRDPAREQNLIVVQMMRA